MPGIWKTLLLDYYLARCHGIRVYGYYSTSNGGKRIEIWIALRIPDGSQNGGHYETQ